jgi:hypothetical protein
VLSLYIEVKMEPPVRVELTTSSLQVRRSTN